MPADFPEVLIDDATGKVTVAAPAVPQPTTQATPVSVETTLPAAAVVAVPPPIQAAYPADRDPHSVFEYGKTYQSEQNVCVRCGSTNLAKGIAVDYSDKFHPLHFSPRRNLKRLNSIWSLRPFRSLVQMNAVACRDCGAVLLVLDPSELRHAERKRRDD
jgi:ribosomal protein L40E